MPTWHECLITISNLLYPNRTLELPFQHPQQLFTWLPHFTDWHHHVFSPWAKAWGSSWASQFPDAPPLLCRWDLWPLPWKDSISTLLQIHPNHSVQYPLLTHLDHCNTFLTGFHLPFHPPTPLKSTPYAVIKYMFSPNEKRVIHTAALALKVQFKLLTPSLQDPSWSCPYYSLPGCDPARLVSFVPLPFRSSSVFRFLY